MAITTARLDQMIADLSRAKQVHQECKAYSAKKAELELAMRGMEATLRAHSNAKSERFAELDGVRAQIALAKAELAVVHEDLGKAKSRHDKLVADMNAVKRRNGIE